MSLICVWCEPLFQVFIWLYCPAWVFIKFSQRSALVRFHLWPLLPSWPGSTAAAYKGGEGKEDLERFHNSILLVLNCSSPNLDNSIFPSWFCFLSNTWVLLTGSLLVMSLKELSKLGRVNLDLTETFMWFNSVYIYQICVMNHTVFCSTENLFPSRAN